MTLVELLQKYARGPRGAAPPEETNKQEATPPSEQTQNIREKVSVEDVLALFPKATIEEINPKS
jgi:hypothetical protein